MEKQNPNEESLLARFARYVVNENVFAGPLPANAAAPGTYSNSKDTVAAPKQDKEAGESDSEDISVDEKMAYKRSNTSLLAASRQTTSQSDRTDQKFVVNASQPDKAAEPYHSSQQQQQQQQQCLACAIHGPQLEAKILSSVRDLVAAQIRAEMPDLVDQAVRQATKKLHKVAQDAARGEMDKYVEEIHGETEEDKVQALASRLGELSEETVLERVLMQRSVLEMMRRLVEKAEMDMSMMEWEEL